MDMKLNEISQVVVGKILTGEIDANGVPAKALYGPYQAVLEDIRAGKDQTDLMAVHGWEPIKSCLNAADATGEMKGFEWVRHLEEVAKNTKAGNDLSKLALRLQDGEEVDAAKILRIAQEMDQRFTEFTPFGEVEPLLNPWVPTFFAPWDEHIGGYPAGGLTIIAGPAGLGKTTLLLELLNRAAQNGKKTAFFSLELVLGVAALRAMEVNPKWTKKSRNLVLASEIIENVDEVYAKSVALKAENPDLWMIGIDYADKMIDREQSEQEMGHIYNQCSNLAKTINTPVVLIAGMSRGYVGGEPMANHIRYSGRAEHDASLIILLVNPEKLMVDMGNGSKGGLPHHPGMGYLKVGKSRFGTKEGGLGAIQLEWNDTNGSWGDNSFGWYPIQVG